MDDIILYGWDSSYSEAFEPLASQGFTPARVIAEHRESYIVHTLGSDIPAEVSGKLMFSASSPSEFPKTGDWVAVTLHDKNTYAIIHSVLPRRTVFSRNQPGEKIDQQVLAANIDTAFLVQGLDNNFNTMRLLRYLSALKGTLITPVAVLNKSDLNPDSQNLLNEVKALISPAAAVLTSGISGNGLDALKEHMKPGKTHVFLGSSGAGKSTLINALAGANLALTSEVRESDSRGRHTTVARQLFCIEGLGLLIDTPGMREFQLWAGSSSEAGQFDEIDEHAKHCRFRDCTHTNEPGCGVKKASDEGLIKADILKSYFKLKRELDFARSKTDPEEAIKRKENERKFGRHIKDVLEHKDKRKKF